MRALFFLVVLGFVWTDTLLADIIITPPGLNPGDQYHLLFVSSTTRTGNSSDVSDYNSFVTTVANTVPSLSALGTTWTAIASTATVAANDNTMTDPLVHGAGVPFYSLGGSLLALTNGDFWDASLGAAIHFDETGTILLTTVFTGTDTFGEASDPLGSFAAVRVGESLATNGQWVTSANLDPAESHSFYAMSGVITVVPEPSTFTFLFIASLGGVVYRWRPGFRARR